MGYCIDMKERTIKIKPENSENIIKTLRDYAKNEHHIPWVHNSELIDSTNLEKSMEAIRYPVCLMNNMFVISHFQGEKLGNDFEIFTQIAPYIEDGYIEYVGEDDEMWRYVFKDGKVREVYPKIVW